MSVYGYERPTTPNLEEFARGATLYRRTLSQGVWTLPGHASMFTGLYPAEHQADWLLKGMNVRSLTHDTVTLAERFRVAGYHTGCVAANEAIFGRNFGLTQGFDLRWAERGSVAQLILPFLASQLVYDLRGQGARSKIGALERNQFAPAQLINRIALRWLDRTESVRPRFLYLNYMEVHGVPRRQPCAAPIFGSGVPCNEWDVPNWDEVMAGRADPDPELVTAMGDWYDTELACLDLHLGELFDGLKEAGRFEDALIVVTSDHGQMLGEHRALKHQAEVWEELIRVPLIVKLPGQTEGVVCDELTETADLALALPLLTGIGIETELPAWVSANAFVPDWNAELAPTATAPCPLPGRSDYAFAEAGRMGELADKYPWRWDKGFIAVHEGGLKYVRDTQDGTAVADIEADPSEVLRDPTPEELARLNELLTAWSESLVEPPEGSSSAETEAEAEARLRALRAQGYLGTGKD